jgi:hypothetical protein
MMILSLVFTGCDKFGYDDDDDDDDKDSGSSSYSGSSTPSSYSSYSSSSSRSSAMAAFRVMNESGSLIGGVRIEYSANNNSFEYLGTTGTTELTLGAGYYALASWREVDERLANIAGRQVYYYPKKSIVFRFMKEGYYMETVSADEVPASTDYIYSEAIMESSVVIINVTTNSLE